MIEIVLSVCLISAPETCKDVNLTYMAENATPYGCMHQGQIEAARWVEGHPKWKVTKWKCGAAREFAKA